MLNTVGDKGAADVEVFLNPTGEPGTDVTGVFNDALRPACMVCVGKIVALAVAAAAKVVVCTGVGVVGGG